MSSMPRRTVVVDAHRALKLLATVHDAMSDGVDVADGPDHGPRFH